jgi:hypothetical protein
MQCNNWSECDLLKPSLLLLLYIIIIIIIIIIYGYERHIT